MVGHRPLSSLARFTWCVAARYLIRYLRTVFSLQNFLWEEPWDLFTEEERASAETFQEKFYLELFDAVGGGLICR